MLSEYQKIILNRMNEETLILCYKFSTDRKNSKYWLCNSEGKVVIRLRKGTFNALLKSKKVRLLEISNYPTVYGGKVDTFCWVLS